LSVILSDDEFQKCKNKHFWTKNTEFMLFGRSERTPVILSTGEEGDIAGNEIWSYLYFTMTMDCK